jgi:hypothetical protein
MASSPPPPPVLPAPQKPPKTSLLSWWAIIPVAIFITIQLLYGGPHDEKDKSTEFAVGYIVGGCLFAVVASSLVAWIAHYMSDGSTSAATVTFTLIMGLCCAGVVAQPLRDWSARRAKARAAAKNPPEIATFGDFQFEIPAGWKKGKPKGENTQAQIILPGARPNLAFGLIQVDVGGPAFSSDRETAQSFAGADGQVLPHPLSIAGAKGVRAQTPSKDFSRPRHVVVIFRNGKVYLIMAAEADGADVREAFDHILVTWRWIDQPATGK